MGIGKLFLTSISTGILTPQELLWVAKNQLAFSKCEKFTSLKLAKLLDSGQINLGCRL